MIDDLLQKAVRKLVEKEPGWAKFVPPEPRGALPAQTGRSATPAGGAGGGGSGGNRTEIDYTQRQHHPDVNYTSTDGWFVWVGKPIKRITFLDEASATVYDEFKAPP